MAISEVDQMEQIINVYAKALVGILCKRIEMLEDLCKGKPTSELLSHYPNLFKSMSKELIYENSRVLKNKLRPFFIPTVVYKDK